MTLAATLTADLRARASWMPYCALCSLQVGMKAQTLRGPSLRKVPFPPSHDFPEGRTIVKVEPCCSLSDPPENYFDDEASAAAWWRAARLMEIGPMGDEMRRRRTLARLEAAGLEPIE